MSRIEGLPYADRDGPFFVLDRHIRRAARHSMHERVAVAALCMISMDHPNDTFQIHRIGLTEDPLL